MGKKNTGKLRVVALLVLLALLLGSAGEAGSARAFAQEGPPPPEVEQVNEHYTVERYTLEDGTALEAEIIHGSPVPPEGADLGLVVEPLEPEGMLSNFPSYSWVFGDAAVSGAMIAGYYDRNGYTNMYTGPTDGGVMPLTDTSWPMWTDSDFRSYPNNPLVASHAGVDGRGATDKGSIDDYWVKVGSSADPYVTGSWMQHTWGSAIGDYMKTSHGAFPYQNADGSTKFWNYTMANTKLTCSAMESIDTGLGYTMDQNDGTYGRKAFYEARGYTVKECWNQMTYNRVEGGFSLADLQAEIDAGHPVLVNLTGLTVVAYGYSGTTVFIRNTWDSNINNPYTMVWDDTPDYSGYILNSVSIVKLASAPIPVSPAGTYWTRDLTYKWTKWSDATAYQYRVWDGGTKICEQTVSASACGSTYCTDRPTALNLIDGTYKWTVRAKVDGIWLDWAKLKWFSIKAGFDSQFTTDAAGWQPTYGAWTWDLYDGNYRTTGIYNIVSSSRFNQVYGIYTYEVKLRRQGSEMDTFFGVLFNGNPWPLGLEKRWNKAYAFYITRSGYFAIGRYDGGMWTALQPWTDRSDLIRSGWYNTLKVTYNKTTGFTQFFINGTKIGAGTFTAYKWGNVGVTMNKSIVGWEQMLVDWATLNVAAPSSPAESGATGGIFIDEASIVPVPGDDTGH